MESALASQIPSWNIRLRLKKRVGTEEIIGRDENPDESGAIELTSLMRPDHEYN